MSEPEFNLQRYLIAPFTGKVLVWVALLLFYISLMILPLVGQAGRMVSHYWTNALTFAAVVFLGLVCSGLALYSLILRAQTENVRIPWKRIGWHSVPPALVGINIVILFLLFANLLSI